MWGEASAETNYDRVIKVVFKTLKQADFNYIPYALEYTALKRAFNEGKFPNIRVFEAYVVRVLNNVTKRAPQGRARAQHAFRMNMNAGKECKMLVFKRL